MYLMTPTTHLLSIDFDNTYCDHLAHPQILNPDLRMATQIFRKKGWKACLTTDRTPAISMNILLNAAAYLKQRDPKHWQESLKQVLLQNHLAQFDEVRSPLHLVFRGEVVTRPDMTTMLCDFENVVYTFICQNPEDFMRLIVNAYHRLDQEKYAAPVCSTANGFMAAQKDIENDVAYYCENHTAGVSMSDLRALQLVLTSKVFDTLPFDRTHKRSLIENFVGQCQMVIHMDRNASVNEVLANELNTQTHNPSANEFRHNLYVLHQIDLAKEHSEREKAVLELQKYVKGLPFGHKNRGLKLIAYIQNPDKADWREAVKMNIGNYNAEITGIPFKDDSSLAKGFKTTKLKGTERFGFYAALKRVEAVFTPVAEMTATESELNEIIETSGL